ncbi:MAG: DNA polymerase III subunit delta [Leptospira sp.]|nr:DNA polymerase III subunit delta [Leptospira sp.]
MEPKKKPSTEFSTLFQLLKLEAKHLPQCFGYVGEDSFEFELVLDHYKKQLNDTGHKYEVIVITSEAGEQAKLFAELFTPDMFFPRKLIILKQAANFFKTIIDAKASGDLKDYGAGFRKNITNLSDDVFLILHYDGKEIPKALDTLFQGTLSYYKTKVLYQSDYAKTLKEVCEKESVALDREASEEFIHRIPPNLGAYLKSIQKLKQYLHKSKFNLDDINSILFNQNELNVNYLVDALVQLRKQDFFKEFTKFSEQNAEVLNFLTRFSYKLDEIRKIKVIRSRHNGEVPIPVMDDILKTSHFSDGRKNFIRKQLIQESSKFSDKILEEFYSILIEMNIKFKSGLRDSEGKQYFLHKIIRMFSILQEKSSS